MKKIYFKNQNGLELAGRPELQVEHQPQDVAFFAYCFTTAKNLRVVLNIGRVLAARDFGVLPFYFTCPGESENA